MQAQLKLRTEYHFSFAEKVYGPLARIIDTLPADTRAAAIADNTSFAHIAWHNALSKKGIKPILGMELRAARADAEGEFIIATALARNSAGLEELYALASTDGLREGQLYDSSPDVIKIAHTFTGPLDAEGWHNDISPRNPSAKLRANSVLISDNFYPRREDRPVYELLGGSVRASPSQFQHIMLERDRQAFFKKQQQAYDLSLKVADSIDCPLPRAPMITTAGDLEALCRQGIAERGYTSKWTPAYEARLVRELGMIREKKFDAYFLVISDMVRWAKSRMLVGPARGSAAGSIACFLANITDVDPLLYDLIFERFIDVTRIDLPDIDLDFPDDRRSEVIDYLTDKYGAANVAHIGTVLTWQPRSILSEFSKKLNVPAWELDKLKGAMITRSSGDSRAANCLLDTLETMDIGKEILQKYGAIKYAAAFEGHAKYAGTHAAGIIVCNEPIAKFATVRGEERVAQIDKVDAEKIGLLKIDILGLRTLSVIEDTLREINAGIKMLDIPLDDPAAFAVLNDGRFAGIFQFEGDAVQMLTKRMTVENFADIAALGALARPGPLDSGGATLYTDRRTGREPTEYLHPLLVPYTEETRGIIVYQEQVMTIGREIGNLDWEDVTQLRKAMSKSMGKEFFDQYWEKFRKGAEEKHQLTEKQARYIWDNMNTMGCLAGDTRLLNPFPNHSTPKTITIKQLARTDGYVRDHAKPIRKGKRTVYDVIKRQQLYALDGATIKPVRNEGAFFSGVKETFELRTQDGHYIRATANHQFLTYPDRWFPLSKLKRGMLIATMGSTKLTARKAKTSTGSGAHNRNYHSGGFAAAVAILKAEYKTCQRCHRHPYTETHHVDENPRNNALSNLLPLCHRCHRELHGTSKAHSKGKQVYWSMVESISEGKMEEVYDIQMPAGVENFVANGIVVHNSWAFNKSHSVSYGLLSYWCCWLKAHYPLAFAAGTLRNTKGDEQVIHVLRELTKEGIEYVAFDAERSLVDWSVGDGKLLGGFLNLKGFGNVKATKAVERRQGAGWTPKQREEIARAEVLYAVVNPAQQFFGKVYDNPRTNGFPGIKKIYRIAELTEDISNFSFIGCLMKKNPRDLNEYKFQVQRLQEGKSQFMEGDTQYLNLIFEDDTGKAWCTIGRRNYQDIGIGVVNDGIEGKSWYLIQGYRNQIGRISVNWLKELTVPG